jgi:tetratricopeptide (TPR) repeat protein
MLIEIPKAGAAKVGAYENWRWNYVRDLNTRLGARPAKKNPGLLGAAQEYPAYVPTLTTRLFRRHAGVYYEGSVHESLTGRLAALGLATGRADFVVHHFGFGEDAKTARLEKNELYQALGKMKLEAHPDDPQAWFEMGLGKLEHARRPAAALGYFERACQLDSQFAAGWLFAGVCLIRLGRLPEAQERLGRTAELGLRNAVYYQALGDAHFHAAHYAEAREAYAQVALMGEASPLSTAKLGASEVHLGEVDQGIRHMQEAVASDPGFGELYDILAAGALLGGYVRLAADTAEARLELGTPKELHFQLAAALQEQLGERERALAILSRGRAAGMATAQSG